MRTRNDRKASDTAMELKDVILFSTALLAIVNPLGSAVLFAAVAGKFAPKIQRRMANQSAFAILIILLVCAWLGNSILGLMGLTPPDAASGRRTHPAQLRPSHGDGRGHQAHAERARLGRRTCPRSTGRPWPWCRWRFPAPSARARSPRSSARPVTFANARDLLIISAVSLGVALVMWITFRFRRPDCADAGADRHEHHFARDGHSGHRDRVRPAGPRHRRAAARVGEVRKKTSGIFFGGARTKKIPDVFFHFDVPNAPQR